MSCIVTDSFTVTFWNTHLLGFHCSYLFIYFIFYSVVRSGQGHCQNVFKAGATSNLGVAQQNLKSQQNIQTFYFAVIINGQAENDCSVRVRSPFHRGLF